MKYEESDIAQTTEETSLALSPIAAGEIIIGTLTVIDRQGQPFVDFSENVSDQPLKAMTTLAFSHAHVGRQVALLFANGSLQSPVIIGMIRSPLQDMLENFAQSKIEDAAESETGIEIEPEGDLTIDDVLIDGSKIIFEAKEKIVLKCGESSITLTKDGKISIRGKNLLSRSTGVNRILGGSVQVN